MISPRERQRWERIYQRHREEVVLGRKTARELMDCAKAFLDFREVPPLERYSKPFLRHRMRTFQTNFQGTEDLKDKTPAFAVFLVEPNEKSQVYYQDSGLAAGEPLEIFLELQSGDLYTSSPTLQAKLRHLGGIDLKDLAERNLEFVCYMMDSFPEDEEHPLNENNPCISSVNTVVTTFVPVAAGPEEDTPDTPQEAQWRKLSLYGTDSNC